MMKKLFLLISFISLLPSLRIFAEEFHFPSDFSEADIIAGSPMTMPVIWTYDDCVKWAIANNIDIRQNMLSIL